MPNNIIIKNNLIKIHIKPILFFQNIITNVNIYKSKSNRVYKQQLNMVYNSESQMLINLNKKRGLKISTHLHKHT